MTSLAATPVPSPDEARANQSFDALLWALSRPGQTRHMPVAGEDGIIQALLDRECRAYSADPELTPAITRTGAEIAPVERADYVFLGQLQQPDVLRQVTTGSDLYPDAGATVVLRAQIGHGPRLRLSGPGVDGTCEIQISGLPEGMWSVRSAVMRYPMGFDLFLVDGDQVVGIPRSCKVEVL